MPRGAPEPQQRHAFCESWLKAIGGPFMLPFIEGEPLLSILPDAYEERKADLLRGTQDLRALTSEEEAAAETGDTAVELGTLTLPAGEPPEPPS